MVGTAVVFIAGAVEDGDLPAGWDEVVEGEQATKAKMVDNAKASKRNLSDFTYPSPIKCLCVNTITIAYIAILNLANENGKRIVLGIVLLDVLVNKLFK